MKKSFKRAGVAVLSMAMLLSMGAVGLSVNAIDPPSDGVVITLPSTPASATYEVYQIASATWDAADGVNVFDTVNADYASLIKVKSGNLYTAADVKLEEAMDSTVWTTLVGQIESAATDASKMSGSYDAVTASTIKLAPGYYYVKTSGVEGNVSPIIFEVQNIPQTLASKASVVSLDKGIVGNLGDVYTGTQSNGPAGMTNASGKVGDKVMHKIIADIPNYKDGITYDKLNADYFITDSPNGTTIINGATNVTVNGASKAYNEVIKVGVDNDGSYTVNAGEELTLQTTLDEATAGYTLDIDADGKMTVTLSKQAVVDNKGGKVVIEYFAVIDDTAVVSDSENDNKNTNTAKLNYDNKFEGGGADIPEDKRPSDDNHVFTTKVKLTKTFTNNKAVAGAEIELYRYSNSESQWKKVGDSLITTTNRADNEKTWTGLDAGNYKFVEKTAPDGFAKAADVEFTINEVPDNGDDTVGSTHVYTFTTNPKGEYTMHNKLLNSLPGTGGIGTVLFTVGGAAIVLLAGVMFVLYMRKRRNEE